MKKIRKLLVCASLLAVSPAAFAQVKVTGTILDFNGEPIIGATVLERGTRNGVTTDLDGKFHIDVASDKSSLVVSYIGYTTQNVLVGNKHQFTITMKDDNKLLDDVVVVGYGTQKKATLTGAVASISGDVLESRPVSNVAVGLQGQIPGLTITRTSARPGDEGLSIQLRGASSVNSVEPLIIIDGVPVISNTEFSSLNPNDIENISVLKDGSAAIYGARAAGGVILVTTKKGKKGEKMKVTYNGMVTANSPANMIPIAGMKDWASTMAEASYQDYVQSDGNGGEVITQRYVNGQVYFNVLQEGGKAPHAGVNFTDTNLLVLDRLATGEPLQYVGTDGMLHYYESNNWIDQLYGTTFSNQHNASISGSSERARWNASLGYANDRSVIKITDDGVKKYTARLNMDYDLTKWLTYSMGLSYNNRYKDSPIDGLDGNNSGMFDAPIAPAYTPAGNYYDLYSCGRSPVSAMKEAGRSQQEFATFRFSGSLVAQINKDFKATASASLVKNDNIQTTYKNKYYVEQPYVTGTDENGEYILNRKMNVVNDGTKSYVQERSQRTFYENYLLQLDYAHTFGKVHNVAAMVNVNAEKRSYKNVTAGRSELLYDGLHDINTANSNKTNLTANGGSNAQGYISYLARLNYNYADKYMVEAVGRRDGTSKFHPDYRWSNFGYASAGWRISEEKFVKDNVKWIDNLKVRVSYGSTGGAVSGLGNYDYLSAINLGSIYFNGGNQQTAYLAKLVDYTRTWERLRNFNVGVDFAVLNNRLTGSFDWYQKNNNNMLVSLTYPDVLGTNPAATNSAKLRVRGWEASIAWNDKVGQVNYWVSASLSDARSMVTDYAGTDTWKAGKVNVREGYPLNSLFVYKTDGYFKSYEEIDEYYQQYKGNSALSNVAQSSANTHLRPGDRKKVLILDPEHDTTNGKGNTGAGDVYHYGDTDPHFNFGFNAGAKWKGFDFSMFIQGVGRRYIMRDTGLNTCAFYANYTNILTSHMDTWSWDNQNAEYARLSLQQNKNKWNVDNNDTSVQNAWYARLKNISVGYTLPSTLTGKWSIEKLRFYVSGDNVAEITGISDGYDPEKGSSARTSLPFSRSWTIGVDLTF